MGLGNLIRFSNRFVGPMVRLSQSMQQLAEGHSVQPIKLRNGDYWQDFAAAFNQVLERVGSHGANHGPNDAEKFSVADYAAGGDLVAVATTATGAADNPSHEC